MSRAKLGAYQAFRAAVQRDSARRKGSVQIDARTEAGYSRVPVRDVPTALPRVEPYRRCTCGSCPTCRDNEKWDRIFAKFESKEREVRGMFQCPLNDL